jgi:hypothetical protein
MIAPRLFYQRNREAVCCSNFVVAIVKGFGLYSTVGFPRGKRQSVPKMPWRQCRGIFLRSFEFDLSLLELFFHAAVSLRSCDRRALEMLSDLGSDVTDGMKIKAVKPIGIGEV